MPAHFSKLISTPLSLQSFLSAVEPDTFRQLRQRWTYRMYEGDGIYRLDDEEMMDVLDIPSGYD